MTNWHRYSTGRGGGGNMYIYIRHSQLVTLMQWPCMHSSALVQYTPIFRLVPPSHLHKACKITRPKCVPRDQLAHLLL